MQLFQILSTLVLLGVGSYFVIKAMTNVYIKGTYDSRGVFRRRDIRTGRFVKMK